MKHLLICREYPPAPSGGIGTYAQAMARILADAGETVHVIAQLWKGAEAPREELLDGRLVVHRVPFLDWTAQPAWRPHPDLAASEEARGIYFSTSPGLAFGYMASLLAERLVEEEGIDLIEAQEFEAPLYFFQLRRALGLGPARKPPVVVHLHSPTECITLNNDEDIAAPYRLVTKRLEDYTIGAADALICPSRWQAEWVEKRHGLAPGAVRIIRLPLGRLPVLPRRQSGSSNHPAEADSRNSTVAPSPSGPVLFVGRLAAQKGVLEFVEAAVSVARDFPEATFAFVGGDVPYNAQRHTSMREFLLRRIPADLHNRFAFHGEQPRARLGRFLASARCAVIPSRFENFPYTSVEAMASGLPVLCTPTGGMAEMVEDGVTGWIARSNTPADLAEALRRSLSTPADELLSMGARAARSIRAMCDDGKILAEQMEFRQRLVTAGASASLHLPGNLPVASQPLAAPPARRAPSPSNGVADTTGLAVVITCYNLGHYLDECLKSVRAQSRKPAAAIIVDDGSTDPVTLQALDRAERLGWRVLRRANGGVVSARNQGAAVVRSEGTRPLGFVFLDADDRLRPDYLAVCEDVLRRRPEVGLVSTFTWHFGAADQIWARPCPAFPYQWLANEAATFSAVRTEAFDQAGGFREILNGCYSDWDLFNAILAGGWVGVTVPLVLGDYRVREDSMLRSASAHAHGRMRRALMERFPEDVRRDAMEIALLAEADAWWTIREEVFELRARMARVRHLVRRPHEAARFVARKLLRRLARR